MALSAAHTHRSESSASALVEEELSIAGRRGPIRARLYHLADAGPAHGLVVAHGVHYRGIDEARLVPFARELARAGLTVMTPELRELADYRITADGVDTIADAVLDLGQRSELVESQRVGVLGFSFAGGLSLVAAERPELRDHLSFVASVGGHHDLSRVLRFCSPTALKRPAAWWKSRPTSTGWWCSSTASSTTSCPRRTDKSWKKPFGSGCMAIAIVRGPSLRGRTTPEAERLFTLLEKGRLAELRPQLEQLLAAHERGARRAVAQGSAGRRAGADLSAARHRGRRDSTERDRVGRLGAGRQAAPGVGVTAAGARGGEYTAPTRWISLRWCASWRSS